MLNSTTLKQRLDKLAMAKTPNVDVAPPVARDLICTAHNDLEVSAKQNKAPSITAWVKPRKKDPVCVNITHAGAECPTEPVGQLTALTVDERLALEFKAVATLLAIIDQCPDAVQRRLAAVNLLTHLRKLSEIEAVTTGTQPRSMVSRTINQIIVAANDGVSAATIARMLLDNAPVEARQPVKIVDDDT